MVRRMYSTNIVNIQGPAIANTAITAINLGTNARVASWICVTAWNRLTSRPTINAVPRTGAETIKSIKSASCPIVKTICAFIAKPLSYITKLAAREPISKFQPSASTNSINLKGNATSTGDNIIMPSDISTLATTISITRNGMKIMKPI